jgi:hypothetical protein
MGSLGASGGGYRRSVFWQGRLDRSDRAQPTGSTSQRFTSWTETRHLGAVCLRGGQAVPEGGTWTPRGPQVGKRRGVLRAAEVRNHRQPE